MSKQTKPRVRGSINPGLKSFDDIERADAQKALEERASELTRDLASVKGELANVRDIFADADKRNGELKERLVKAELSVHWMRGYIARVREDDIVREELVLTGDAAGEQVQVPKRKFEPFPGNYNDVATREIDTSSWIGAERPAMPRKHWVNY